MRNMNFSYFSQRFKDASSFSGNQHSNDQKGTVLKTMKYTEKNACLSDPFHLLDILSVSPRVPNGLSKPKGRIPTVTEFATPLFLIVLSSTFFTNKLKPTNLG